MINTIDAQCWGSTFEMRTFEIESDNYINNYAIFLQKPYRIDNSSIEVFQMEILSVLKQFSHGK